MDAIRVAQQQARSEAELSGLRRTGSELERFWLAGELSVGWPVSAPNLNESGDQFSRVEREQILANQLGPGTDTCVHIFIQL